MKFKRRFIALVAVLVVAVVLAALVFTGVVPLTGAASTLSLPNIFGPSKDSITENVKSLYALANPAAGIEVVTTTEQDGMYKIVLRASGSTGTTYKEVYVTKDGRLLTENMILVGESIAQMTSYKNFVDCLDGKGVRIAGVVNQTATMLQLNLLGTYSPKLFVDCSTNLDACLAANITQVPSVVIGQYVVPGVQSVEWFSGVTGCNLAG